MQYVGEMMQEHHLYSQKKVLTRIIINNEAFYDPTQKEEVSLGTWKEEMKQFPKAVLPYAMDYHFGNDIINIKHGTTYDEVTSTWNILERNLLISKGI